MTVNNEPLSELTIRAGSDRFHSSPIDSNKRKTPAAVNEEAVHA